MFVDTNIPVEVLKEVSDRDHVLIMLADPEISVNRFFDRPDRERQFSYRLLQEEDNAGQAMGELQAVPEKNGLQEENYREFLNSGFSVILRDERRSVQQTLRLAQRLLKLPQDGAAR